jgi:hypothetical protein
MIPFNVIISDFNAKRFVEYNVMTYFINEFEKEENKPETFEDCKKFIDKCARYMFWSRCQYEVVLVEWPSASHQMKWDVYEQLKMNLDIVTKVFMENVYGNK